MQTTQQSHNNFLHALYLDEIVLDFGYLSLKRNDDFLHFSLVDIALDVKGVFISQLNVADLKVCHDLLNSLKRETDIKNVIIVHTTVIRLSYSL